MEMQVTETFHSLVGMEELVNLLREEVTSPVRRAIYETELPSLLRDPDKDHRKLILVQGSPGSGKRAVASAVTNELRRGLVQLPTNTFYQNDKIKFIEWDRTPWESDLDTHFCDIINSAKCRKDGRIFTVLYIERLDNVCPSIVEGGRKSITPAQERLISVMKEEIVKCPPGAILVIGSTSYPDAVDKEILKLAQSKYSIPKPDESLRRKVTLTFFEKEKAEINNKGLDFMLKKLEHRSLKTMKMIVEEVVERARRRESLDSSSNRKVVVLKEDACDVLRLEEDCYFIIDKVQSLSLEPTESTTKSEVINDIRFRIDRW